MYNVENLSKITKHAKKQKKTTHHEGKKNQLRPDLMQLPKLSEKIIKIIIKIIIQK